MKLLKGLISGYVGEEVTFTITADDTQKWGHTLSSSNTFFTRVLIIIHPIENGVTTTKSMPSFLRVISSFIESRLLSHISRN